MSKNHGFDRMLCGLRDECGDCKPLGTPCSSVADSLCVPLFDAYVLGEGNALDLEKALLDISGKTICVFWHCLYCLDGKPKIKKANWFERTFLHRAGRIVCSECGETLLIIKDFIQPEFLEKHIMTDFPMDV